MKKKTAKATQFIENLHQFIVASPQFRRRTRGKSEVQIQTEIRPLIIRYLEEYFARDGIKDAVAKANRSFYWDRKASTVERGSRLSVRETTPTSSWRSPTEWLLSTSRARADPS